MTAEPPLTYEQARDQLIEVVHQLESGDVPLSRAMELWQRGESLARLCQGLLDDAAATIEAARTEGRQKPPEPEPGN